MTTRRTLCPLAIDLGIYALILLIMCTSWTNCLRIFISVPAWRNSHDVAFVCVCEREYYSSSYSKFLNAVVSGGKQQRWAWGDICDLGFVPTEVPPGEADSSWTHLCRERHVIMVAQNASLLLFPSLCGLGFFSIRYQVLSRLIPL